MDLLKSAVASISKGPAFPYTFGDRVDIDQSIWTLHNGIRRVSEPLMILRNSTALTMSRKTVRNVASSHSTPTRIDLDYLSPKTRFESSELLDTPVL